MTTERAEILLNMAYCGATKECKQLFLLNYFTPEFPKSPDLHPLLTQYRSQI